MESQDRTALNNIRVVHLQSNKLSVDVLPDLGAMISSITDWHQNEYLADPLRPRPAGLELTAGFNNGGLGGIDDCLPAVSKGVYPTGPFKGWQIPDHGEVWLRAWEIVHVGSQEATFFITGLRLPYTLTRRMLVVDARLRLEYTLTNHGDFNLPVVWASHPMLRITPETSLDLGSIDWLRVEASSFGAKFNERLPYPVIDIQGDHVDLRKISSLPEGVYLKAFSPHPKDSVASVHYPEWNTTLSIKTTANQSIHIGIWLNKNGFPVETPLEHISIEPTFGSSDSLEYSYQDGSCLMLEAHTTEKWIVEYQVVDQDFQG